MASATLYIAVLLATLQLGSCLRCYQCNSQSHPECKDPFTNNNKFLVDCSTQDSINFNRQYLLPSFPSIQDGITGAARYCHKIELQTGTVVRTCLDSNPSDLNHTCRLLDGVAINAPGDLTRQLKHCSVCRDHDACNGAGSIAASLPLAALAAFVAYLCFKQ